MKAADVEAALAKRWPDEQCLHIKEAPLDSGRQGTKIDVLVIHLWQSKRLEFEAVEVKVSYSDWRKEIVRVEWWVDYPNGTSVRADSRSSAQERAGLKRPAYDWIFGPHIPRPVVDRGGFGTVRREVVDDTSKSRLWRQHAHRFWVAAPMKLAKRIVDEAPDDWGVLGVDDAGVAHALRKASRMKVTKPLTHGHYIGLLRASVNCGVQALYRARQNGYEEGRKIEQARQERLRNEAS